MSIYRKCRTQGAHRTPNGFTKLPAWQVAVMRFVTEKAMEPIITYFRSWHDNAARLQQRSALRWPEFHTYAFRSDEVQKAKSEVFDASLKAKYGNVEELSEIATTPIANGLHFMLGGNVYDTDAGESIVKRMADELEDLSNVEIENEWDMIDRPEIWHFVPNEIPCWYFYRTPYALLHSEAQLGNIDSILKVLKLNKSALHDPYIRNHYIRHLTANGEQVGALEKALSGHMPVPTRQETKHAIAGLVKKLMSSSVPAYASLNEKFPQLNLGTGKVTMPQLKRFYDDAERARTGRFEDPELGDDAAFGTSVRRWVKRMFG